MAGRLGGVAGRGGIRGGISGHRFSTGFPQGVTMFSWLSQPQTMWLSIILLGLAAVAWGAITAAIVLIARELGRPGVLSTAAAQQRELAGPLEQREIAGPAVVGDPPFTTNASEGGYDAWPEQPAVYAPRCRPCAKVRSFFRAPSS